MGAFKTNNPGCCCCAYVVRVVSCCGARVAGATVSTGDWSGATDANGEVVIGASAPKDQPVLVTKTNWTQATTVSLPNCALTTITIRPDAVTISTALGDVTANYTTTGAGGPFYAGCLTAEVSPVYTGSEPCVSSGCGDPVTTGAPILMIFQCRASGGQLGANYYVKGCTRPLVPTGYEDYYGYASAHCDAEAVGGITIDDPCAGIWPYSQTVNATGSCFPLSFTWPTSWPPGVSNPDAPIPPLGTCTVTPA